MTAATASGVTVHVDYVCSLSPELVTKAEKELNEKPEWRHRDIQAVREMVKAHPALRCPVDDLFILKFLRARKFDYERAFQLILNYFRVRNNNADIFHDFRPSQVELELKAGVTYVLPSCDSDGRKILIFRPALWDTAAYPLVDIFKANLMAVELLLDDEAVQVSGVIIVCDFTGFPVLEARHLNPFICKKFFTILQDAYPCRIKGIHFINEPVAVGVIYAMLRPFLKEKTASRLHFHGSHFEELHNYVNQEVLPDYLGGKLVQYSQEDWTNVLLGEEERFVNMMSYGLDTNEPCESETDTSDTFDCVVTPYRKLRS